MVPRTLSFLGYGKLINFILDRWPEGNDHFYMSEVLGIPEIDFAFMHREDFWEGIEPFENAELLLRLLSNLVGKENVYFLSSPGIYEGAWTGKFRWIKKYFPGYERRLILTRHKHLMAGPAILIDDKYKTVEQVNGSADSAYQAVLYPAPWNQKRGMSNPISHTLNAIWKIAEGLGYVSGSNLSYLYPSTP